jgi:hypothetical protein
MCVPIRPACTVGNLKPGEKFLNEDLVRAPLMVTNIQATPGYATVVNLITGVVFEVCHNTLLAIRDDAQLYVSRKLNKPALLVDDDDYCDLGARPPGGPDQQLPQ